MIILFIKKTYKKNNFEFVKDKNSLLELMNKFNNSVPKINRYSNNFLYSRLSNKNTKFFLLVNKCYIKNCL